MDYLSLATDQFAELMRSEGRPRVFFVHRGQGRMMVSHPSFEKLGTRLQELADFREHEALFLQIGPETGALFGAFIHNTRRGQAAGGVRHWRYSSLSSFIRDGLRLSLGMGRKNALAGLWWGGGKGIIARQVGDATQSNDYRRLLYREFGAFITSLRGCYVTAEDVGTQAADMAEVFRTTRFVTCVPPEVGGSGNPSCVTASGVISAVQAALDWAKLGGISGKRINVQGLGNVATSMIEQLLERGVASVLATDIAEQQIARAHRLLTDERVRVRLVDPSDTSVFSEACEVFAPCALGGVLNPTTIPLLDCRIVCGSANNQLLDDRHDDELLADRKIIYVPDFVANRMGIVNCANEQYGVMNDDPAIVRHFGTDWENSVHVITQNILTRAHSDGVTPNRAANSLADELLQKPHPIWGHRSQLLIESLVRDGWQDTLPAARGT